MTEGATQAGDLLRMRDLLERATTILESAHVGPTEYPFLSREDGLSVDAEEFSSWRHECRSFLRRFHREDVADFLKSLTADDDDRANVYSVKQTRAVLTAVKRALDSGDLRRREDAPAKPSPPEAPHESPHGNKWTVIGVVVAVLAMVSTFFIPEVRHFFGLK